MDVSVILCTYNRSKSLSNALESLAGSIMPLDIEWEVLVVDNNSKDDTRDLSTKFCERYPGRFRYIFEPRQGKSHALNTGISNADGEILAFVDDDVTVGPMWLQDLTSVLREERWSGSAGPILPAQSFIPPRWLALEGQYNLLGALCAYYTKGDIPHDLDDAPYGANMAFRKGMFEKHGGFRTDLGPRPGSELRSEDTEFGRRLLAQGERLRYVPSAVVYHEIHQERINKRFFLDWWYHFGAGGIREGGTNLTIIQALKIVRRIFIAAFQGLASSDPKRRFYCRCQVWFGAGKLNEGFRRAFRDKRGATRQAEGYTS